MGVISNGTTLLDAGALDSGIATGAMTLIKTLTASSSATLSFVDGASSVVLDNTYDSYVFKFIDIHPSAQATGPTFQVSIDGGSNYGVNITSTYFRTSHNENGDDGAVAYQASQDLAQSTNFQNIGQLIGVDNDQTSSGYLHLFNPSSTTFVKHFIARVNISNQINFSVDNHIAGYGNTTSAIDAVQFKMNSGNIDAGDICLYGIA